MIGQFKLCEPTISNPGLILVHFIERIFDDFIALFKLDILRLQWQFSQSRSGAQNAVVAGKFFKEDNLTEVFVLIKNELTANPGGLAGLVSARMLVEMLSRRLGDEMARFERETKNRGNIILACIDALRNEDDFDSAKKAQIAQLLDRMAKANATLAEMLVKTLSDDEDDNGDSIILTLIAKGSTFKVQQSQYLLNIK